MDDNVGRKINLSTIDLSSQDYSSKKTSTRFSQKKSSWIGVCVIKRFAKIDVVVMKYRGKIYFRTIQNILIAIHLTKIIHSFHRIRTIIIVDHLKLL
jgi:hypothetical protein